MPYNPEDDKKQRAALNGTVVPFSGPSSTQWMLVGEAPGVVEAKLKRPFVGPTGRILTALFTKMNMSRGRFHITNLVKEFVAEPPAVTPELIAKWEPSLMSEIADRNPRFIIAAGLHACRWFLGDDVSMDLVHGIPHRSMRAPGAVILPCYHPASCFYDDDSRGYVVHDFRKAFNIIGRKEEAEFLDDPFEGKEDYRDVTGAELERILRNYTNDPIAIDTEGFLDGSWNWSIQVCLEPGTGLILRCERPDFARGIAAIGAYCLSDHRPVVIFHNLMHDMSVCRKMGLDLFDANIIDTRYLAYIMRTEPQGLKALAYRWCGMKMLSYNETVGDAGLEKQLTYLAEVAERTWPDPEQRLIKENNGEDRIYTPQPINKTATRIITDFVSGKTNKNGEPTDPMARWKKCDIVLRRMVEAEMGPFPVGTLADIPLERALFYAGRDPDATLRLYYRLWAKIKGTKLESLALSGCNVLPIFEEMQDTGMEITREYCEQKVEELDEYLIDLQQKIQYHYWPNNTPFNPNSPDHVRAVMRSRDLVGAKKTKSDKTKMSTSKKSIEHLRYTDDAIRDIVDWREHQKMRDSFYKPFLEIIGDADSARIRTTINPYKVISRRISSSNPNLTAIPVRNELGVAVRAGFHAGPGRVLAGWDLSQVEMRYMAHESQDPLLLKFFHSEGLDVHSETAIRIFRLPAPEIGSIVDGKVVDAKMRYSVVDEMKHRYPSKRAGFGIITSITGSGLLDQLRMAGCEGWDERKCDTLIRDWLEVYGGVKRYMDASIEEANENGYVEDRWGMRRPLPGVWFGSKKDKEKKENIHLVLEAERAASSMKIQGGAQGMLQNAMEYLKPQIRLMRSCGIYVRWVLQIHDEAIFEIDEEYVEYLNEIVVDAMTKHHGVEDMSVPIKCSGHWSKSWGGLK